MRNIHFEKANLDDKNAIFEWLDKPHIKEFWDNSPEYREDILNFMEGRKEASNYFEGIFTYWVGFIEKEPYCLLMTSDVLTAQKCPAIWEDNLSKTGKTVTIDFCIGNEKFLGKGLAAPTLEVFTEFFQERIDRSADTFFIDPADTNPRAKHVYKKAGFETRGYFVMGNGFFEGEKTYLMVKKLPLIP